MSKKSIGVTTLTPSYNDKIRVFRLLDSIKNSGYSNVESIVIVGDSGDTIAEGRKKYPWVKWLHSGPIDVGQTGRYNIGFAHANPKNHMLYCDSDVVFEKDMITKLVKRAESKKKIGVVTPMILYLEDRNWINQAGAEVDLKTGRVSIGWGKKEDYLKAMKVQGSGTVMLFTRDLVNKIGCFEDWYMCYFDPDYCVRALKAGFENWYEPKAICYHDQPKDDNLWRPRILSRAWLSGRNRTLFMRKHGTNILLYIVFLPFLLGYYLKESIKYNIFPKWWELVCGTVVGFFSPVNHEVYIPIPKVQE